MLASALFEQIPTKLRPDGYIFAERQGKVYALFWRDSNKQPPTDIRVRVRRGIVRIPSKETSTDPITPVTTNVKDTPKTGRFAYTVPVEKLYIFHLLDCGKRNILTLSRNFLTVGGYAPEPPITIRLYGKYH